MKLKKDVIMVGREKEEEAKGLRPESWRRRAERRRRKCGHN